MEKKEKVLVIHRHLVFVRFIDIPSLDDAEIERMVEFQAVKEVLYPKEDMIISYRKLGSFKDGFSSLMLVIAKRQMIEEMARKVEQEGYKLEGIRLNTELLYLFLLKKGVIKPDKINLIIHIGREYSEIMIIQKHRLVFSRGLENSDRFLEEVDRSILVYERDKNNPAIDNVVVTYSSDIDMRDISTPIREHFRIPINFYEYSDDLANMGLPLEVELLPKDISNKRVRIQKKQEKFLTYILMGLILILSLVFLSIKLHEKNRFLDTISLNLSKIQVEVDRLDNLAKKTEVAKRHREKGKFIIEILKESHGLIPNDISISGLDYDGKENISYKGTAQDLSNIFPFIKKLEGLKYFGNVQIKYATKKKVKGEEFTDFNIQCQLGVNYR